MYPTAPELALPVVPYHVAGYHFGQRVRRHVILWATHLGDDLIVDVGTSIPAIGEGQVVWSALRLGSEQRRNWGGLVVIGHTHRTTQHAFFSVYGHLHELAVRVGDHVSLGQSIGIVAPANSPENGWWKTPHLHFALYTGPWSNEVLPGYKRPEQWRTKLRWWASPEPYITAYNQQ